MDKITLAREMAIKFHKGQVDKAGNEYINHLFFLESKVNTEEEKIVAPLHDIVEDTDVSIDDLKNKGFSKNVIEAIECITKKQNEDYLTYLTRVKNNKIARTVKLIDLSHNMDISRIKKS